MENAEKLERLKKLAPRQREVFRLFCKGSDYAAIAKAMTITEGAVRAHMANIYVKLGLDELSQQERWKEIFQEYCPLMAGLEEVAETTEAADEVAPSEELLQKVEEDQFALVPVEPIVIATEPTRVRQTVGRPSGCVQRILGIAAIVVITILALNWLGLLNAEGLFAQDEPTSTPSSESSEIASALSSATNTDSPTATQEFPTATSEPSSTPRPTSTPIPLPFSDSFDTGPRPEWEFYGNWLVTDGSLTMQYVDFEYVTASLDLTGWTDYRITVDLYIKSWGSANTSHNAIFVRRSDDETMMLGFFQGFQRDGGWAIYPTNATDPEYIAGRGGAVPQTSSIRLDVIGDTFTAYVNGIKIQEIFYTGYDRGTLVLASLCQGVTACPLWDNLVIEPLD